MRASSFLSGCVLEVYKYGIQTRMPVFTPEKVTKKDRQMRLF